MKMRTIRVRSLLAGCISCLRCVCLPGPAVSHADRFPPFTSPPHPPRFSSLFFPPSTTSLGSISTLWVTRLSLFIYLTIAITVGFPAANVSRSRIRTCWFQIESLYRSPEPLPCRAADALVSSCKVRLWRTWEQEDAHAAPHTAGRNLQVRILAKVYLPASSCRIRSPWGGEGRGGGEKNERDGAVPGSESGSCIAGRARFKRAGGQRRECSHLLRMCRQIDTQRKDWVKDRLEETVGFTLKHRRSPEHWGTRDGLQRLKFHLMSPSILSILFDIKRFYGRLYKTKQTFFFVISLKSQIYTQGVSIW